MYCTCSSFVIQFLNNKEIFFCSLLFESTLCSFIMMHDYDAIKQNNIKNQKFVRFTFCDEIKMNER